MRSTNVRTAMLTAVIILLALPIVYGEGHQVSLYLFYGKGCPHCAKELRFLDQLSQHYPELELNLREIYYNSENAKLFSQMANSMKRNSSRLCLIPK